MALIVEDGTGKADAESYISVSDAASYLSDRGYSAFAALATDALKEAALRKATDYMEQAYRTRWKGTRVTATQALSWPRLYVEREDYYVTFATPPQNIDGTYYYPGDEVPVEVKNACALLALKSIDGDLNADLTQGVKREKVDVLEVEYDSASPQYVRYRAIDNMLAVFITGGVNSKKVVRV